MRKSFNKSLKRKTNASTASKIYHPIDHFTQVFDKLLYLVNKSNSPRRVHVCNSPAPRIIVLQKTKLRIRSDQITKNRLANSLQLLIEGQTWTADGRRSNLVAREGESPTSDLTEAEPSVQLEAEQRGDARVLDVQVTPVFPQQLRLVDLLPE